MGERVGRVWQGVALFAVGVLVGAALLGSSISLPETGGNAEAQAQDGSTWQTATLEVAGGTVQRPTDPSRFFDDWVETLPVECDLGPLFQAGMSVMVTYRCP